MPVDMGRPFRTQMWGCNCRAWKPGQPGAGTAIRALAKVNHVRVEELAPDPSGLRNFAARTVYPETSDRYEVTYDPGGEGGFCKHAAACASQVVGNWLAAASHDAAAALLENDRLEKENKRLRREAQKWQKKSGMRST